MGEAALKSHMIGKKHVDLDKIKNKDGIGTMKAFLGRPTTSSTTTDSAQVRGGSSATASSRSEKVTVGNVISRTDTLKAEVLWSLKVMNSHYSYKSCEDIGAVLGTMFHDSNVAQSFTCGERKCVYLCCFGLAPHFKQLLSDKINVLLPYDTAI